jgi:hypothetical protein
METAVKLFFCDSKGDVIFLTLALLMKENVTDNELVNILPTVRILKSSSVMLGWA